MYDMFVRDGLDESLAVSLNYDIWLVALSCLIAVAGAYAALQTTSNVLVVGSRHGRWLVAGASLAMGVGIWAMHFVGMLAAKAPFRVSYDPALTAASIVPALVASALCMRVLSKRGVALAQLLPSGVVMGGGIGAMHYLGMAAMRVDAEMRYDPMTLLASLVAAVVLASLAVLAVSRARAPSSRQTHVRLLSSVLLGGAVSVMHYLGMSAVRFYPTQAAGNLVAAIDEKPLAVLVAIGAALVIAAVIGASVLDRRIGLLRTHVRGRWRQLTAAIEGIAEGFVMFDEDRRVIVWNTQIESMLPELKGHLRPGLPCADLFVAGDARVLRPLDSHAGRKAPPREVDLPGGRCVQVRESVTESGYLVVSLLDITVHKRAKQRLSAFFESAPYAFITVNADGVVAHANRLALEIFGYGAEELVGQSCSVLFPRESWQHLSRKVERCLRGEASGAVHDRDTLGVRKNGGLFPIEISQSVIDFGRYPLVVLGLADLSEKKRIEEQLSHSQKMEMVGQLTGGLAHDFNNLLTVVIGNLQLLDASLPHDEQSREQIKDALEAAGRGSDLTRRLLAFSRRQLLAPHVLSINRLVTELMPLVRKTFTAQVQVTTKLAEDLWHVEVDPSQLESALLNLALNARDAMPMGGTLTIETRNVTLDEAYAAKVGDLEPGDFVRVTVTDSGTGMTKEVLRRAFEPFFSTKGPSRGSGLGLSMVYGFVKQSKGHINIYSEVDVGTSVRIYLPRSEHDVIDEGVVTGRRRFIPNGDERILLVDDDPPVRRTVAQLLASLGYDVVEVDTASAALARLNEQSPFDLLFTDIVMPGGMSGLELAERAKRLHPNLRVLLTSGYTDTAMLARGVLEPTEQILNKPYSKAELAAKVRDVLDQPVR